MKKKYYIKGWTKQREIQETDAAFDLKDRNYEYEKKSINNNVSISGHRKATLLENGCCSSIQSRCSGRKCASWPVNGLLYAIKKNKKQVGFSAKTKLWGRTLGSHKRSTDQQSTV